MKLLTVSVPDTLAFNIREILADRYFPGYERRFLDDRSGESGDRTWTVTTWQFFDGGRYAGALQVREDYTASFTTLYMIPQGPRKGQAITKAWHGRHLQTRIFIATPEQHSTT